MKNAFIALVLSIAVTSVVSAAEVTQIEAGVGSITNISTLAAAEGIARDLRKISGDDYLVVISIYGLTSYTVSVTKKTDT